MGIMWDTGRERDGREGGWEYCDSLSMEAYDIDTGRLRFDSGEVVIIGGRGGGLEFEVGEEKAGGGEAGGEEVADMTAVIFGGVSSPG